MPLLSIVIANYNYGRFLEEAIQSVITQDGFDQCELIVVDGGSTDNSVEIIKKYANRIAWWVSEKDKGQSDAFNKGFAHAQGRFLTWLNADDVFTKGAIRSILKLIERHPSEEWFIGSSLYADENLRITKCFCSHRFSVLRAKWGFLSAGGPSSFFTKRLLNEVGGVDVNLHYVMDTDLWYKFYMRAGKRYRRTIHNIFAYRQHEASKMSGADQNMTSRAIENRRKAGLESLILNERYGARNGLKYKIAHWLSLSLIDYLIATWRNFTWRNKYATEI